MNIGKLLRQTLVQVNREVVAPIVQKELEGGLRRLGDAFVQSRPSAPVNLGQPANKPGDAAFVKGLYEQLLGRQPDLEGFAAHMLALANGATYDQVRQGFLSSPEYQARQNQPAPAPVPTPAPAPTPAPTPAAPKPTWAPGSLGSNDEWRQYVQALLKTTPGVGPVATPEGLAKIESALKPYGGELQRNSAGEIRGRLYLPTGNPSDPWGRAVDFGDWNKPWQWIVR